MRRQRGASPSVAQSFAPIAGYFPALPSRPALDWKYF